MSDDLSLHPVQPGTLDLIPVEPRERQIEPTIFQAPRLLVKRGGKVFPAKAGTFLYPPRGDGTQHLLLPEPDGGIFVCRVEQAELRIAHVHERVGGVNPPSMDPAEQ